MRSNLSRRFREWILSAPSSILWMGVSLPGTGSSSDSPSTVPTERSVEDCLKIADFLLEAKIYPECAKILKEAKEKLLQRHPHTPEWETLNTRLKDLYEKLERFHPSEGQNK